MINGLTVLDILKNALQITGTIAYGEQVDPDLARTALITLNGLRAEWSGTLINNNKYDVLFTAPTSTQFITLGTNPNNGTPIVGDIPIRPGTITDIIVKFGTVNLPLKIRAYEEYRELPIQTINAIPQYAYVDNNYPLQNIYFYPGLSAGQGVRVLGKEYLKEYENIGDTYVDLPELFNPLVLHLAMRMGSILGATLPMDINIQAQASLKHLKNRNFVSNIHQAKSDFTLAAGFNFFAGV